VREIQSHLEEMYGAEVSPTLTFSVTDDRGGLAPVGLSCFALVSLHSGRTFGHHQSLT